MADSMEGVQSYQNFIETYKNEAARAPTKSNSTAIRVIMAVLVLALCFAGYFSVSPGSFTFGMSKIFNQLAEDSEESGSSLCPASFISVTASNEYGALTAPYPFLMNGELLAEPYKTTTFTASGSYLDADYTIEWDFSFGGSTHEGSSVDIVAKYVGTHSLTNTVYNKNGDYVCESYTTVYVK